MKTTLRSALLATICFGLAGYTLAAEPKRPECIAPVSYTHLTLPTIYSV